MPPSPQPPSLRSAKGSKELNGEVRTGEQTKTETRLMKSTSHVNIEVRAQPGLDQPRYWLKVTTMTKKNNTTSVVNSKSQQSHHSSPSRG